MRQPETTSDSAYARWNPSKFPRHPRILIELLSEAKKYAFEQFAIINPDSVTPH
jgi:hypothetical protein